MLIVSLVLGLVNAIVFLLLLATFVDTMREPDQPRPALTTRARRRGRLLIRLWQMGIALYVLAWVGHIRNILGLGHLPISGIVLTLVLACTLGIIRIRRYGRVF